MCIYMTSEKNGLIYSSIILLKSRREIIFGSSWIAALASIIAGKGFPPIYGSILSIIAVMMIVTSVYIYNDIIDSDMDAYSKQEKKKKRPIAHGLVSENNAMIFVAVTGLLGLGICLILNPIVFVVGLTYYILVFLYSHPAVRFKEMFIIKNLVASLLLPTSSLISGVAIEKRISTNMAFLSIIYYLLCAFTLPAVGDMLDYEEDLAFNIKTIGNSISWKSNLILYNIGVIILFLGSLFSYLYFEISLFVPIVSSILCVYLMVYSFNLRNEDGKTASYKLRPLSYVLMLLNPLLLAFGSFF